MNYSDLFVYKYVFNNIGILNYKIINDLDIVKSFLNDENIIIFNWSSSINYAVKFEDDINVYPINYNIINNLNKEYIILTGDMLISDNLNKAVYTFENIDKYIFNFLKQPD